MNNGQHKEDTDKERIVLQEEYERLKDLNTRGQQKRNEIDAEREKLRSWEMEITANMEKEKKDGLNRLNGLKEEQIRRKEILKKYEELERKRSRLMDLEKTAEIKQRIAIKEEMTEIEAAKDMLYKEDNTTWNG